MNPLHHLAISYANPVLKPVLERLLSFDQRLAEIVLMAKEPLIAQMRLAWWREQLSKPVSQRPQGEPWLIALAALDYASQEAVHRGAFCLIEAWEYLLSDDNWDEALLRAFAKARAKGVFLHSIDSLNIPHVDDDMFKTQILKAGTKWAFDDLAQMLGNTGAMIPDMPVIAFPSTVKSIRALSLLGLGGHLQRHQKGIAGYFRLLWHGLTGR